MQLENSVSDFPYPRFSLVWLPNTFKIMRFPANADVPLDQLGGANLFLARTSDEVSVLCETRQELISDSSHGPLRGFRVAGQLEFELVGVLAELTRVLARAKISVVTESTFNTDYIFIEESAVESAIAALQEAGFKFDT